MGQIKIRHDSEITLRLLETAPEGATMRLATGYFNLTSEYSHAILESCKAECLLLTAHPTANGFYGIGIYLKSFFYCTKFCMFQEQKV